MDINSKLKNSQILLSVFSSEFYNSSIIKLMQELNNEKVCYVTLNKPSDSLRKNFRFNGINTRNIFFIDAITSSIDKNKKLENGILVSSPRALTELSIAIDEAIKSKAFNLLVFDSLSTLKVYNSENTSVRFASSIINRVRSNKFKGIFTCLEGDISTSLIEQSSMYADEILSFKEMHSRLRGDRIKGIGVFLAFIVGLLAGFSFLYKWPDNLKDITGFAAYSSASSSAGMPEFIPFLLFAAVLAAIIAIFYRKEIMLRIHHNSKTVNNPSRLSNKKRVRAGFRKRISEF